MTYLHVMTIPLAVNSDITHILCCYVQLQARTVFTPHFWNICWIDYSFLRSINSLHMKCVYATLLSNCAKRLTAQKDPESCEMCLRHVTAQKIMSHAECGYATFSSNCAKQDFKVHIFSKTTDTMNGTILVHATNQNSAPICTLEK